VRPNGFTTVYVESAAVLSEAQALRLYEPEAKTLHSDRNSGFGIVIGYSLSQI
jgi:hypothetical protein